MPPTLRVLFTIDCPTAGPRAVPYGPPNWEASVRSVDAFSTAVLRAGFLPTLFVSPESAEQHAPLCEDFATAGAEVGLLIHPPLLRGAGLKHLLGAYARAEQEAIAGESRRRFSDALARRPLSVRSALYSASDDTFSALDAVGFRQSSVSSPGRRVPKHHADWSGAPTGVHFASASDRRAAGDLSLLEIPVTTDHTQRNDGIAPDLAIENGTLERWHRPLLDAVLERHDEEAVAFRVLCFVTSSRFPYFDEASRQRQTLDDLLEYLDALGGRFEVTPATPSGVYGYYRETLASAAGAVSTNTAAHTGA